MTHRSGRALVAATAVFFVSIQCMAALDGTHDDPKTTCRLRLLSHQGEPLGRASYTPFCKKPSSDAEAWFPCGEELTATLVGGVLVVPVPSGAGRRGLLVIADGHAPGWVEPDSLIPEAPFEYRLAPASGVRACLERALEDPPPALARFEILQAPGFPAPDVLRQAGAQRPDDEGCFHWGGLPSLTGRITLSALGSQALSLPLDLHAGASADLGARSLRQAQDLRLLVVDDRRTRIGNAPLSILWTVDGTEAERIHGSSDPNGEIRIPHFGLGTITLDVSPPCCSRWIAEDLTLDRVRSLREVLVTRFGQISGRCIPEEDPNGVLDAHVCARGIEPQSDGEEKSCTETDGRGGFLLASLDEGSYTLEVEAEGRPRLALRGLRVSAGVVTRLEKIEVPQGASVRILVLDGETGSPIEGAVVALDAAHPLVSWIPGRSARTDSGGIAEIGSLPEGVHPFTVSSASHAPTAVDLLAELGLPPMQEISLSPGGSLAGTVLWRGEAAEGDRIQVLLRTGARTATVDPFGSYSLHHLPAGSFTVHRLRKADGQVEAVEALIRDSATTILDFGKGPALSGTILRGGRPLPGVRLGLLRVVSWERSSSGEAQHLDASSSGAGGVISQIRSAVTDLDGVYVFEGLDPGAYWMTLQTGESSQTRLLEVAVDGNARADIALDQHVITGEIRSSERNLPLAGAQVHAVPVGAPGRFFSRAGLLGGVSVLVNSQEEARTLSGHDGRFSLEVPGPGPWSVGVTLSGYAGGSSQASAGLDSVLDFILHRETAMEVWVEGPGGLDAAGATVYQVLRPGGGERLMIMAEGTDSAGRLVVEGRAGEAVWLVASHPSFAPSSIADVRFPESGRSEIRLSVRRGAGALIALAGSSAIGAETWDVTEVSSGLSLRPFVSRPTILQDATGSFLRFERLPPTDLLFSVDGVQRLVTLIEGNTTLVTLDAVGGGRRDGSR